MLVVSAAAGLVKSLVCVILSCLSLCVAELMQRCCLGRVYVMASEHARGVEKRICLHGAQRV